MREFSVYVILIPALVSALVALGVEWLAKPTLEARKARILDEHARRRAPLRTCRMILVKLGALRVRVDSAAVVMETKDDLRRLTKTMQDEIVDVALDLPPVGRRLASYATGMLLGMLHAKTPAAQIADECVEPFEIVAWILETSWVQPGRWIAKKRATAWLERRNAPKARSAPPPPPVRVETPPTRVASTEKADDLAEVAEHDEETLSILAKGDTDE
jgi:hypothetical protein